MSHVLTILGCGSSGGVPRIGNDWGTCDPTNDKNRRRRCSVMVERRGDGGTTRLIIDTSPDLREQMLSTGVSTIDGVWYTHEHADHTHGIDELRGFFLRQKQRIPVWADDATLNMLKARFSYCFRSPPGSEYPPILGDTRIISGHDIRLSGAGGDIVGLPFRVFHGTIDAMGFRIGNVAYTPDINGIPAGSMKALEGLDIWIVDALKRTPHSSHFHLEQTLRWIDRLKPGRAVLTNMHVDMDYQTLISELPEGIEPAYDDMRIEF
jgi:phosphoribosyl 1,2-cyclic phosphate phosphodiesterase